MQPLPYKKKIMLGILEILDMLSISKIFTGYAEAYPADMVAPPMPRSKLPQWTHGPQALPIFRPQAFASLYSYAIDLMLNRCK
jgi:hypothetical protein